MRVTRRVWLVPVPQFRFDAFRAALRSNHNDAVPPLNGQRLPLVATPRRRFSPQLWIVAHRWRRIAHCCKETLTIMAVVGLMEPERPCIMRCSIYILQCTPSAHS